jgi:hypothetical protein
MAQREHHVARGGQQARLSKSANLLSVSRVFAGTGAIRQEKTPTENGWGFIIGGAEATGFKPTLKAPEYCWVSVRKHGAICPTG